MFAISGSQVDNEADADIVVIPYWVDLLCRMSQESELLWDEFNKASARRPWQLPLVSFLCVCVHAGRRCP